MRVLGVLLGAVEVRLPGQVLRAEALRDVVADGGDRLAGDARRVRTHVGDEADRALVAELDALVEPLGDAHRAGGLEAELARRLLLQARGDEGRCRMPPPFLLLDLGNGPARAFEAAQDLVDPLAGVELEL